MDINTCNFGVGYGHKHTSFVASSNSKNTEEVLNVFIFLSNKLSIIFKFRKIFMLSFFMSEFFVYDFIQVCVLYLFFYIVSTIFKLCMFWIPLRRGNTKEQGTGDLSCDPPPGLPCHSTFPLRRIYLHIHTLRGTHIDKKSPNITPDLKKCMFWIKKILYLCIYTIFQVCIFS